MTKSKDRILKAARFLKRRKIHIKYSIRFIADQLNGSLKQTRIVGYNTKCKLNGLIAKNSMSSYIIIQI